MGNPANSARLSRSQLLRNGIEVQDWSLYSLVTLPAAINPANGVLFFGDTESTVGRQRTNMTRPNEVPGKTNFEVFGVGLKFLAPLATLYTSFNDAMRDAWIVMKVNNAERRVWHMSEFFPATVVAPSFSAAAGDNPVLTHQGLSFYLPLDPSVQLLGGVAVELRVFFSTNVAALANTVMGLYLNGLIDRGDIKLDPSPVALAGA